MIAWLLLTKNRHKKWFNDNEGEKNARGNLGDGSGTLAGGERCDGCRPHHTNEG